jgi:hypothetical protein
MWWVVVVVKRQARCAGLRTKSKVAGREGLAVPARAPRPRARRDSRPARREERERAAVLQRSVTAASRRRPAAAPAAAALPLHPAQTLAAGPRHARAASFGGGAPPQNLRRRQAARLGATLRLRLAPTSSRRASARANYAPGTPPHPSCLRRGSSIPLLQLLQQHAAESVSHAASLARLSQHASPARSDRGARRDEAQAHPRGAARRSKLGAPARRPDRMPRRQKGRGGVGVALPSAHVG